MGTARHERMFTSLQSLCMREIAEAVGGRLLCGDENKIITDISTDSRLLSENTLFVPIKGEHFDGHDFIDSSVNCISEKEPKNTIGKNVVLVDDTVLAFGKIAKYYKNKYNVPTVSVVGSVGKTTTRDMISAVLSQKYNTLKTEKNYNNNIGVPIMVTKIEKNHEAAVLELGMSALGEIEYLADIVRPNVLVMTNIGMSHIENLGSQDNIFKAKMEGTKFLTEDNTVIANGDDKYLKTVAEYGKYKTLLYSIENKSADIYADNIVDLGFDGCEFDVHAKGICQSVKLSIPGIHNVHNALAAFAVGMLENIEPKKIAKGLLNASFTGMRMDISEHNSIKIINDCYNAAPSSVKAALNVLKSESGRRKVAVLGDVFELGNFAEEAHRKIGSYTIDCADVVVCVGNNAKYIAEEAKTAKEIHLFDSTEAAKEKISSIINNGDIVLLKASRGMHFEEIFKILSE